MRQIDDAHVARPGLAVVEVAAADDETAFEVQELLGTRWGIAPADRTSREPGEPWRTAALLPGPAPGTRNGAPGEVRA
ncbi:DUF6207 family protein [Streptomyces sp. NPDC057798]|uniref:DUF6207 family protein n=1 Tax=Streptomyces sp. NPDC057798 TaxID=3346252 RepID=UPI00368689BF